jgi:hypothetical protein
VTASPADAPAHHHPHASPHAHHTDHAHSHVVGTGHTGPEGYGPSHQGSVMVDIGGNVGALIIHTSDSLLGAELELSPVQNGDTRTHVAVRERRGGGSVQYAAIFPSLTAGTYTLWHPQGHPAAQVTISGGDVTQFTWPA